jgi:hypothetical protein
MADDKLKWEQLSIADERLTAQEIKDSDSGGKLPPGKWLCTVESSFPKEAKLKEYTCFAATLKLRIDEVIELNGKPVKDGEGDSYEGQFIFDDIMLPHPEEKQAMKNRRIHVARRLGLIGEDAGRLTMKMWADDVVGKRVIVFTEDQEYTDKSGNKKTAKGKVPFFDGYDFADKQAATPESYSDI